MLTTKAGKAIPIEIDEVRWKLDGTGGLLLNMRLITRDFNVLDGVRHVQIVSDVSTARAADNATSPWKTTLSIIERGGAPIRLVHIHMSGVSVSIPCDLTKAIQVVVNEVGDWRAILTVRASMGVDESYNVHRALCYAAQDEALTASVMEFQGGLEL